eukprot:137015_1
MTPPTVLIYHEKFPIWKIILLIFAAVFIVLLIIYFIYKYKWKKAAMFIKNPLIIAVAIGIYDDRDDDLEGIDNDVKNIRTLFRDRMNYTVHTGEKQIPLEWKSKTLLKFLEQQAKHLSHYVSSSMKPNGYDGLLVVISSHGDKGDN